MKENILTQDDLRRIFDYDPELGELFWKRRDDVLPQQNTQFAGKRAGHVSKLIGYVVIRINKRLYLAHRIIWCWVHGYWPPDQVDHINHNRSDNRLINLRLATNTENMRNGSLRSDNKSGQRGVLFDTARDKWRAEIKVNGKAVHLGRFKTFEDAVAVRKAAEIKYFGEFATQNHVERVS